MSAEITEWVDAYGAVTALDVDWEATGRFMPEVNFDEDEIPGYDGSRLRRTRFKPRTFTLKIVVTAASEPLLRTALRSLTSAMNPKTGMGYIRVTSPLGDARQIACKVAGGLGLEEKEGLSGPQMQMALVTFHAFDPFWTDTSDTSTLFDIDTPPSFFPIFPLRLTASEIAVDITVDNDGDDEMWPVWTINGPGSGIALRNLTTGKSLVFTTMSLGAGESIVIDTRPDEKTAVRQDGTNAFPDLDVTSSMWSLQVGSNSVRLEMTGAVAGVSSLQLSYRKRYLSP